jgi:hypothetical protein
MVGIDYARPKKGDNNYNKKCPYRAVKMMTTKREYSTVDRVAWLIFKTSRQWHGQLEFDRVPLRPKHCKRGRSYG